MANSSRRTTAVQSAPASLDATVVQGRDVASEPGVPRLLVVSGPRAGAVVTVTGDGLTMGRGWDNDVVLPDISVSRRHALLRREAAGYVLFDRASGNGTRVNGRAVEHARLRSGDEIALGDSVVRFVEGDAVAVRRAGQAGGAMAGRPRWRSVAASAGIVAAVALAGMGVRSRRHDAGGALQPVAIAGGTNQKREAGASDAASAQPVHSTESREASAGEDAAAGVASDAPSPESVPERAPSRARVPRTRPSAPMAPRVLQAYLGGDLEAALERARTARGEPGGADLVARLEELASALREGMERIEAHRATEAIASLEKAERADAAISSGHDGPLGHKLRKTLAGLHLQLALAHETDSDAAVAAAHLRAALERDPENERAGERLRTLTARATDAYLRGYVAKDTDADAARDAFRLVLAVLPPGDEVARKARRWLDRLDGKAVAEE